MGILLCKRFEHKNFESNLVKNCKVENIFLVNEINEEREDLK